MYLDRRDKRNGGVSVAALNCLHKLNESTQNDSRSHKVKNVFLKGEAFSLIQPQADKVYRSIFIHS